MQKTTFVAAVLCLSLSPAAIADVTFEEETKMGGIMKIATFGRGMKSKTQISGNRMRTENGNEVTIVDLDAEKIYQLDTKKKTYTVKTFEKMRRELETAMAQAEGKRAEAGEEAPDVSTSADVRVTETGRTEEIRGYDCKQYLLELDVTLSDEEQQQSGTLSTVTEMWLTKDAPGIDEMQTFYRTMAEKLGTATLGRQLLSGGEQQGQSQQFGAGMQKMADEMKQMDGYAMRSVFYFGSPEAARKEATGEKSEGGGLGGMFEKMTPFGGGGSEAEQEGGQPGGVVMKMTTETKKIETKSIDPEVFSVPEGYQLTESR